ncbi:unknown [[Mannheimia] succiniciproducens MBEL55E]|uniref:Uncharacterized protein n=1 Tax=Mannheimia succiniciproducens (strain KCTC 0769BP / MBEL55E) TaxID=221988 RepID=Q65TD7_MANSM|nr:unknown [[Mannheimia] succiniciproducens MBEL55E]
MLLKKMKILHKSFLHLHKMDILDIASILAFADNN